MTAVPVSLWRLDDLSPPQRRVELEHLSDWVEWLREQDLEVPSCWYAHGWCRHRLAALMHWWRGIVDPAEGCRWWAEVAALVQSQPWMDALGHGGRHVDPVTHGLVPVPSLDDELGTLSGDVEAFAPQAARP